VSQKKGGGVSPPPLSCVGTIWYLPLEGGGRGGGCVLRAKTDTVFAIFSLSRINAVVKEFAHTILFCTPRYFTHPSVGEDALPPLPISQPFLLTLFQSPPPPTQPFGGWCEGIKEGKKTGLLVTWAAVCYKQKRHLS